MKKPDPSSIDSCDSSDAADDVMIAVPWVASTTGAVQSMAGPRAPPFERTRPPDWQASTIAIRTVAPVFSRSCRRFSCSILVEPRCSEVSSPWPE